MLPSRDRPRALSIDPLPHVIRQVLPDVRAHLVREQSDRGHRTGVRIDQGGLALIPGGEQLRGGRRANQAGVRDPREAHAGDVPRGRVHAVEVPDCLGGFALELTG